MDSGQRPPGKMLCANSLFYIIPQLSEIFNNISGEEKPHGEGQGIFCFVPSHPRPRAPPHSLPRARGNEAASPYTTGSPV